jgi:hypothetical protein
MVKVDKSHPYNRFNINADLEDFHIWREFSDMFDSPMTMPENWYVMNTVMATPRELVKAFGMPLPSNRFFMKSSGAYSRKWDLGNK